MSVVNLNDLFSEMSPSGRWTIVGPLLDRDYRHGMVMGFDGPPGNARTIGELQWSLRMGTSFSSTVVEE